MEIKWFARLLPYFIIEKLSTSVNPDHATLQFRKDHEGYVVDVYEVDAGVWIVKSSKAELMRSRKKLERLIRQIDDRMEDAEI
jgi:hypothetical protein